MKKNGLFLGMLAMALAFSMVLAGCSGKKDSASGAAGLDDLKEVAELAKTAGDAAKALNNVSGGGGTASKPEDFVYDLTADGKGVVIKGLNVENPSTLKIPEKIEGYPVVELGEYSFSFGYTYTSVTIPSSVTKLGEMAFADTGITKITLPSGITEIPRACFTRTNLTSITIPNGVTKIADDAFAMCLSLKEVVIPDSVTEIGVTAFADCPELTTVKLPSHPVKYLEDIIGYERAFENCPKLSLAVRKAITDSGYKGTF
jgi:hypothetical protein